MISFQNIEFLFGLAILLPLAILFMATLRWKKKKIKEIGDPELVHALILEHSPKNYRYKFIAVFIALVLCIIGAANLRSPKTGNTGNRSGVDVMVALDVSNSMLAQDVKPDRLNRARQVLNLIIDQMGDNRMGLVVFAGQAFLQMPLTSDLAAAKLYVSNANPEAVPRQGTVIGQALRICNASLDNKEKKFKTIILISDGEDHDEKRDEVIKELQENGVTVQTIGIGSPEGSPIFDPALNDYRKDETGNTVVSKLNEEELKAIATQTEGAYTLFTNAGDVADKVVAAINAMEKKQIAGTGMKLYSSYFQWFLAIALLLLIVEVLIPERKMKWFVWKKQR